MKQWRQPSPFGDVTVVVVRPTACARSACPATTSPTASSAPPTRASQRQLDDWFAGKRHEFDFTLDLDGVDGFRRTVLETLARDVCRGARS